MAKNKTEFTGKDVEEFILENVESVQRQKDSFSLIDFMKKVTGLEPKMWGPSIIGFGSYRYKYASGHGGEAPLVGFSPRKAAISLYVFTGLEEHQHLLEGLGKFKMGKACIYAKRLSDINMEKLEVLMQETIRFLHEKYREN
jgi:hypothetical protein